MVDQTVEFIVNGVVKQTEHWHMVFRQPSDCMIQRLFDSKGVLGRTEFFSGTGRTIAGGRIEAKNSGTASKSLANGRRIFEFRKWGCDSMQELSGVAAQCLDSKLH